MLNRGEAVNALKRAIYTGRVGPAQARRVDEMQAVADALSLLVVGDNYLGRSTTTILAG